MKNIKHFSLVLLALQMASLTHILVHAQDSKWSGWLFSFFGPLLLLWFGGLLVSTSLIWYKTSESTYKRDRMALLVLGVLSFFSFMITFGFIS